MSANLSHAAQGFVNCVVVGKDIVPRLSVVNIGRLIDELVWHLSVVVSQALNLLLPAKALSRRKVHPRVWPLHTSSRDKLLLGLAQS